MIKDTQGKLAENRIQDHESFPTRLRDLILTCIALVLLSLVLDVVCPFRRVLGISCAGCGMTRAIFAVCRLDFAAAFHYHPLWPLLLPILIGVVFEERIFGRSEKGRRVKDSLIYSLIALFMLVYLIRMVPVIRGVPSDVLAFEPGNGIFSILGRH